MSGTRIISKKKQADKAAHSPAVEESRVVRTLTERVHELESALQKSDACLRTLMDNLPMRVFFKDRKSTFMAVNEAFAKAADMTPAELVGKTDFDLHTAEHARKTQADDKRIMTSGEAEKFEDESQIGEEHMVVEVNKTPIVRPDGEVIGVMGTQTDVTDRHRTKEELDRERDLLRVLLETLPDRVYFKDRKSRLVRCSHEFARVMGKESPAELIGKSDFDLFTEEHARPAFEDEKRIMSTGEPVIGKIEKETWADGRVGWVITSKLPHRSKTGKIVGTFGISRDITELKQTEEKLDREHDLLQALLETIPDRVYFKDHKSRFVRCSNELARFHGMKSPEDLIGKSDFDLFTEEHARPAFEDEKRIMKTGEPVIDKVEKETFADGRVTWVLSSKLPHRSKTGKIIGTFGISRDITSLKQTEAELEREHDLLRVLLETVPDRVYFKDRESKIVCCSNELARFHGVKSPADLIGKSDFDLFTEEHARPAFEDEKRIMKTGEPVIGKIEKETFADGRVTWVLTSKLPHRDKTGRIIGTFGISRDITSLKQAEDELKRSQAFMNSVVENLPIMVFIKDPQLRFVLINKAGEKLTGYSREAFLGKSDIDFYEPEIAAEYSARDREALNGAKLVDIPEESIETRDKHTRILHTRKIPIRDEEGKPLYLLGISEDITERKESEDKLKRFANRMEQHNRELQDFVYVASHDLQEPLRKVQAFGDRLKYRCTEELGAQGRDYLDRVQDAARRMQTLLEDLLTYSRVTTRANPFVPVDLNEVLQDVCAQMEEQFDKVGAKIEAGRLPNKIVADPMQMRQLFQQLISNPLKFRREGEPPRVKISGRVITNNKDESLERLAVENFNITPRNPYCLFFVEDNGIGFDEKYVEKIFVVFQRLHGRGVYDGTGVGLAICRKIVLRHNGEITARSEPGKGSTFIVLLPVNQS